MKDFQEMVTADGTSIKDHTRLKLEQNMGPDLLSALNDPQTVEMMLNPDGNVWLERMGSPMQRIGTLRVTQAQAIIETIAGFYGKEVTRHKPLLEGAFPLDGSRFTGQLPPVVCAPTFAIHKKAVAIFTLDQYVENGMMTSAQHWALVEAVAAHCNILVIGGTGSGKTGLMNAIIQQIVANDPTERIVILEDTDEIQCTAENHVQYHTSLDADMTGLIKTTLRMRPDRILVGEVRGCEALDLLDAWNTDHEGGVTTLHASHVMACLTRLRALITRHACAPAEIESLIAEAVNLIVHIARTPTGCRIQEMIEVSGYANGQYLTRCI